MSEDAKTLKNIKNKQRRQKVFSELKHEKNKAKHQLRAERAKEERNDPSLKEKRLAENVPETLESKRVYDETIVDEIEGEDEFDDIFKSDREAKILLTTSKYAKKAAYEFADLLMDFLPNVTFVKRKQQFSIDDMVKICNNREFTDLIILNEFNKKVTGLTFIHLPTGPTYYFSITSVTEGKKISGHGRSTDHTPELILNNFNTRLGKTVGRLFQSIFPKKPEFEGRQVITLHNQRDFIFFRRHRYLFKDDERVGLQEIGPRFTLKLRRLQKGIREETEWEHRPDMEKDKRKFYL